MNRWVKSILAFLGGFIIIGMVIWASSGDFRDTLQEASTEELVKISYAGGACPNDPTGVSICQNQTTIFGNGSVLYSNDPVKGKITNKELRTIRDLLEETDLSTIVINPNLASSCPSTYDGQDVSLSFPSTKGETLYTLCQIENWQNNELFAYIASLAEQKL